MLQRTLYQLLKKHHFPHQKMAFLVGPRQVGKTTLAQTLLKEKGLSQLYYNWDDFKQKKELLKDPYAFENQIPAGHKRSLVVHDEIHKYPRWKNYLKAVYDRFHHDIDFLVTGSGRLDLYKKGADSLMGRYFRYHLLPFTLGEIHHHSLKSLDDVLDFSSSKPATQEIFQTLWHYSGFPDPFVKNDASFLARWEETRKELIVRQDIRDLTNVREIGLIEKLMFLLPEKVGSPLSINSLCEDLDVSFKTVKNWVEILERVFYFFSVPPYSKKVARALKKERKFYGWNWVENQDEAKRFENLVACHLKKFVTLYRDFGFANLELFYVRDKLKREVDFLVTRDNKPWLLVETKLSEQTPAPALVAFKQMLGLKEAFQLIATPGLHIKRSQTEGFVHIMSAEVFLKNLP